MNQDFSGYFHIDGKTKETLLPNIAIGSLSNDDIDIVLESVSPIFNIPVEEFKTQLMVTNVDVNHSVILYDTRDQKIYGILIYCNFSVFNGSPVCLYPDIASQFDDLSGINGFLFCIDKRLRGTDYDRKMLRSSIPFLKSYDYVWAGVGKELNTHSYWIRLGFTKFLEIPEANFYRFDVKDIIKKYS